LSANSIETSNGSGIVEYLPEEGQLGGITITAQSAGLETAILAGEVLSKINPDENRTIPSRYALKANYPNPFNANTVIEYSLPEDTKLSIGVYNLAGQHVETLVEGRQEPGYYRLEWSPKNLSSGIYFYRISSEDFTAIRKCIYVK
jgi:outer membrane receptor protein involved in Fe transport